MDSDINAKIFSAKIAQKNLKVEWSPFSDTFRGHLVTNNPTEAKRRNLLKKVNT